MSLQNIASPSPGQGGADRGTRPGHLEPTTGHGRSTPRPFAALPHDLAGDPKITPLGKAVLLALLYWARSKDHCWPSDAAIGERVARSIGTIQRTLRHLEALELIRREKTTANRTGRLIHLIWISAGARPGPAPALDHPQRQRSTPTSTALDEGNKDVIVKQEPEKKSEEDISSQRLRSEKTSQPTPTLKPNPPAKCFPTPLSATIPTVSQSVLPNTVLQVLTLQEQARLGEFSEKKRSRVLEWLATGDPCLLGEAKLLLRPALAPEPSLESISLVELLTSLPGRPDRVASAAGRLCQVLGDHKSFGFYASVASAVCHREQPPEAIVKAAHEGLSPQAKRPGAVFATAWKRESRV